MKKENRLKIGVLAGLLLTLACQTEAAAVTQVNRYATVANKPLSAQVNPLLSVQQVHFPQKIGTVGEAVRHWLLYSGYSLVEENAMPSVLPEVLNQPLPQVDRELGPLTVSEGLEVLVGKEVFSLVADPLHRKVSFKLRPQYAKLFNTSKKGKIA